jgi:transcriptional regulator of met regulon
MVLITLIANDFTLRQVEKALAYFWDQDLMCDATAQLLIGQGAPQKVIGTTDTSLVLISSYDSHDEYEARYQLVKSISIELPLEYCKIMAKILAE